MDTISNNACLHLFLYQPDEVELFSYTVTFYLAEFARNSVIDFASEYFVDYVITIVDFMMQFLKIRIFINTRNIILSCKISEINNIISNNFDMYLLQISIGLFYVNFVNEDSHRVKLSSICVYMNLFQK